jgi:hypothetical protein
MSLPFDPQQVLVCEVIPNPEGNGYSAVKLTFKDHSACTFEAEDLSEAVQEYVSTMLSMNPPSPPPYLPTIVKKKPKDHKAR